MSKKNIIATEFDTTDQGTLKINVTSTLGLIPIKDALISISVTSEPDSTLTETTTNSSGQSQIITLPAPPIEYSMKPDPPLRPYGDYNIRVSATGYEPTFVRASQLLPNVLSLQPISLVPLEISNDVVDTILIPDHTLYGIFPPKIPEAEIKPIDETGEIVLSRVVIPEYIIVHDGTPSNSSAPNYYEKFKDYIKNVVSSEIYATWSENTIYANTLVILSFTLNRVYTEWYRGKGYDFTITSSTAFDQKWMKGRNIFSNVDRIVDSIFNNYLSRPGVRQPIFTSYCDGVRVQCSGLSQWGSKALGDEGYTPIEIIRYYYGNDMFINTASTISGVPSSYPGFNLTIGSYGDKVKQVQEQLNRIAKNYPALPTIIADGIYGPNTANAVKVFQQIFNLPQTGVIDFATWYAISNIFVGVSRISEPD